MYTTNENKKQIIKRFFTDIINEIAKNLMNNNTITEMTNTRINNYKIFIEKYGNRILHNNLHLSNYMLIFDCFVTSCINKKNIENTPIYNIFTGEFTWNTINDTINETKNIVLNEYIPDLVNFFIENMELFEELENNSLLNN
jgi:hypothetical protein